MTPPGGCNFHHARSGEAVVEGVLPHPRHDRATAQTIQKRVRGHLKTWLRALQGKRFRAHGSVGQNPVWSKVAKYFPNIL